MKKHRKQKNNPRSDERQHGLETLLEFLERQTAPIHPKAIRISVGWDSHFLAAVLALARKDGSVIWDGNGYRLPPGRVDLPRPPQVILDLPRTPGFF